MKIPFLSLCTIVILLFAAGCSEDNASSEQETAQNPTEVAQPASVATPEPEKLVRIPTVCIREGTSIYQKPGEGFISALSEGEPISYLGKDENSKVEGRESWVYSFVERSDGSQGWALSDYLVQDALPGVIIRDSALYSQPSAANLVPNEKVFARQIVGVVQSKKYESYLSVRWNIPETFIVKEQYVRSAYVSTDVEDVAVARLLHIAVNGTDEESQIEQLRIIQSEFPDSVFSLDVEKALQYVIAGSETD